jgi:hypothetical protein
MSSLRAHQPKSGSYMTNTLKIFSIILLFFLKVGSSFAIDSTSRHASISMPGATTLLEQGEWAGMIVVPPTYPVKTFDPRKDKTRGCPINSTPDLDISYRTQNACNLGGFLYDIAADCTFNKNTYIVTCNSVRANCSGGSLGGLTLEWAIWCVPN